MCYVFMFYVRDPLIRKSRKHSYFQRHCVPNTIIIIMTRLSIYRITHYLQIPPAQWPRRISARMLQLLALPTSFGAVRMVAKEALL